jgi:glycerol uptake facilitator-like aquaporin
MKIHMGPEPRGAGEIGAAGMPVSGAYPAIALRIAAEAAGCGLLTFLIVAAGLLAERQGGSIALAVLVTALAGAAGFLVLTRILSLWAACGFNPALAFALILSGRLDLITGILIAVAQIAAAFLGVMLAHLVANTGLVQVATQIQTGTGVWTGEFLGTGLFVFAMLSLTARGREALIPLTGALALLAISLATPSLCFANPALTLARSLTDSFTAIRLADATVIAGVQCLAALGAWFLHQWLSPQRED